MSAKLALVTGSKPEPIYRKVSDVLWLHTGNKTYYVRKTFRRLRIPDLFESTRESTIAKAKSKADQLIADHQAKYLGMGSDSLARRKGTPISQVIDEVLAFVTTKRRARTQVQHQIYFSELKAEWGTWDINRLTIPVWERWLVEFRKKKIIQARDKKRKPREKFYDYVKDMNIALNYAYQRKYTTHLIRLPNPDSQIGKRPGRVYTGEEVAALWSHMSDDLKDQFALCFECFMRLREALYLTWDRVDLKTGVVTLRSQDVKTGSKTGKGRSFRLSPRALERLRARRVRVPGPLVFPSSTSGEQSVDSNKTAWRNAKKKAGIKGRARWHDLRHSAISIALLDSLADPVLVSEYAGVSLRTIQQVYLHSTHEKTASVANSVKINISRKCEKSVKRKSSHE